MLRRAVEQRPDDGYIIDSLGWAYYRLGHYEEAVQASGARGRAAARDPIINDHLGDAYWRVGRKLEAQFPVEARPRPQAGAGRSGQDRGEAQDRACDEPASRPTSVAETDGGRAIRKAWTVFRPECDASAWFSRFLT